MAGRPSPAEGLIGWWPNLIKARKYSSPGMLCPALLTGDAAGTSVFVFPTARVCVLPSICVCVDGKSNKI